MFIFGDLSNLYFNHDISRQVFRTIQDNYNNSFSSFTFNESAEVANVFQALSLMTINPSVISTESDLTDLTTLILDVANVTSPVDVTNLTCVIFNYANESIDNLTTPFQVLQEIVSNPSYRLRVTTQTCSCIQQAFVDFNALARCYSDDSFIFGLGGVDGILWMIYLFLMLAGTVFVLGVIQVALMQLSTERQIYKMRLAYYKAVLKQDIGWFDVNGYTGELANVLNQ